MKKIYLMLVIVFGLMAASTKAQMSSYVFTPSSGTFTAITGGTAVSTTTSAADFLGDTKTSISIPIGFNFKFNGVNYASVKAMSDGFISFNPLATSLVTNNLTSSTANSRPLVAPLWDDLDGASGTGAATYITTGVAGSRIFTMEWLNWQWNYNATGATISFQVKLYEGSNAIEFIYQRESGALNTPTASIGIAAIATGTGNFMSLNNSTAAPTASTAAETTGVNLKPATGQVYRFEPNPLPEAMDYVNLQFPQTATIALGGSEIIYTQGYEPGVTEAAGAGTGVQAWIGINVSNTDPATWTTWVPATFNVNVGNNDEFQAAIGTTLGAGTYYYASRWQLNTGEYRYGGYPNGFWNGTTQTSGVLTVTPAIANDICSGAIALTVNADLACAVTTAGTTVGATQSPDLPAPTCSPTGINDDVWFSFVATGASHVVTITGATNTTAAQVYGGSCSSLSTIVCGSTLSGTANIIAIGLVSGNTYLVRVYSTSTVVATSSNFSICIGTPPPPPANDNICGAVSLSVSGNPTCTTSLTGQSTQYATQSLAGCAGTADEDVWYSFVATNTTHFITITSSGTGSTDREHQLFSSSDNTCNGTLISLSCSDPENSTVSGLTIGNTYFVRVYSYSSGNFATFDICITSPPACPAPTAVSAGSITTSGATITFTGTGTFILEYGLTGFTPGTGATAGAGGTIINPATSPQAITGLAGVTAYQVYVRQDCTGAGNGYSANSIVHAFSTIAPAPANDDCSSATVIPCDGSVSGNTSGAANDVLPGVTCGSTTLTTGTNRGVWFIVTPVNSGPMTISTCTGTVFDTYLRVYTGACGAFTACTGFDDDGCLETTYGLSSFTFTAVGGTTYYVLMGGFDAADFGAYTISATCPAACAAPAIATMSAVTTTTATATWAGTGTFILEYGPTGYTPGTAGTAGVTGTLINPAVSPQAISGLTASTTYDLYVRQACAGPTWSPNSPVRTFTTASPPPANDNCAAAVTINTVSLASTNVGATESLPVGVCGGIATVSGDVWYSFTALSNGTATVNVLNVVGFDPVVEVYSGTCVALSNIACADGGASGGSEVAALTALVAGQTYYVRVYNYGSTTGTFDISVTGAALPISIEYFKGSKQGSNMLLDWKVTCYSSPSVTMLLERSADGRKFTTINNQTETSLRCLQPFSFTDAAPLSGINYYRLKSVDIDGKESYSKIVALLNKEKGFEIVSLVPNPVSNEAVLSVTSAAKSIIEIVVSDLSGKQLNKQRVTMIAGNNLLPINVSNLPAGTYQVTGITADGAIRTLRFVKQ